MHIFLIVLIGLFITGDVYADRVLIRKSDGVPVEYQSGNAAIGVLKKNHPEYNNMDVEEKYISENEYKILFKEKIILPRKEKKDKKNKEKKDKLKVLFGWSDEQIEALIGLLK